MEEKHLDLESKGLLTLPRELRFLILEHALRDLPVYIAQWTCARSAIAKLQGLTLRIASVEHKSSASASLDYFARSNALQISKQLRAEGMEVLKLSGYHVLVTTHCRHLHSLPLLAPDILRNVRALYLTDACRCGESSNVDDVHHAGHALLRDAVLHHLPKLTHVFLSASTTLAAVDLQMMGLYMSFFDSLRDNRLRNLYVECGAISKSNNYAADVDYEESWIFGPPRVRHRTREDFYRLQMAEVNRRKALSEWCAVIRMPGVVDAYWPVARRGQDGLRFILTLGDFSEQFRASKALTGETLVQRAEGQR